MENDDAPNWYLQEWAAIAGKRQSDLVSELGWLKNHAHRIWHGKQPYRRDIVNQVSGWLGIQPYELLMPPSEALRLRQFRDAAFAIAANHGAEAEKGPPEKAARTGRGARAAQ